MSDDVLFGPVLTARQREVLHLVADGRTRAEIAAALFLSEHTVRTHLREACKRLGAHGRADVIAKAFRAGEIR